MRADTCSAGSLRGYGSGTTRLDLKRRLLDLERGVRRLRV